jgi:IPT/TIG domain
VCSTGAVGNLQVWCAGTGLVATPILGSGQGLDPKNLLKNGRKKPSGENGTHGSLRRHSATAAGWLILWLILMCLLLPGTAFAQAPAVSVISPSAGPTSGGTTVTITGTNLTSATVVDFVTVPGAPVIGTATAGNAQAQVSFTAPASNGNTAITRYTVTSSPSGFTATGSASPITVMGWTAPPTGIDVPRWSLSQPI